MRADGRRNRDALLSAAERLIADKGPDVPLDEIARLAGLGNATLYRHFPTRRDLLIAVTADQITALRDYADVLIEQDPPEQALMNWLRAYVEHVCAHPALVHGLPDGPADVHPDAGPHGRWRADVDDVATLLLYRARRTGAVRTDLDPADLLALAEGIALAARPPERRERLISLLRDAITALRCGNSHSDSDSSTEARDVVQDYC